MSSSPGKGRTTLLNLSCPGPAATAAGAAAVEQLVAALGSGAASKKEQFGSPLQQQPQQEQISSSSSSSSNEQRSSWKNGQATAADRRATDTGNTVYCKNNYKKPVLLIKGNAQKQEKKDKKKNVATADHIQ